MRPQVRIMRLHVWVVNSCSKALTSQVRDSKWSFNLNISVFLYLILVLQQLKVCYGKKTVIISCVKNPLPFKVAITHGSTLSCSCITSQLLLSLNLLIVFSQLYYLKAHRQISKKRCFEKYCVCDQAYQVSALKGTPSPSCLENLTIDDKFKNKRVRLFIHQQCVEKKKLLVRYNKVANSCLITFLKKYRSSRGKCKSSHRRCSVKKRVLKDIANFTGKHLCWCLFLIKLQAFSLQVF